MAASSGASRVASLVPHRGLVFLDEDVSAADGSYVLSHSITGERVILTGASSGALLIIDEDTGDGVVCTQNADGTEDYKAVAELLKISLYVDENGEHFIIDEGRVGGSLAAIDTARNRFVLVDVKMARIGSTRADAELPAALFDYQGTFGQRVAWSLHALYNSLGLTCHLGRRWTWVAKQLPRWQKHFSSWWPSHSRDLFRKAQQDARVVETMCEQADQDRCLPWRPHAFVQRSCLG